MWRTLIIALMASGSARVTSSGLDSQVYPRQNVIEAQDTAGQSARRYCVLDYTSGVNSSVTAHQLRDRFLPFETYTDDTCGHSYPHPWSPDNNTFVITKFTTDCNITTQINHFAGKQLAGLLVSVGCGVDIGKEIIVTERTLLATPFSVGVITDNSEHSIERSKWSTIKLFQPWSDPSRFTFDYSVLCLWVLATFTVCLGAFWSGVVRHHIYRLNRQKSAKPVTASADKQQSPASSGSTTAAAAEEEAYVNVSAVLILGFVGLMSVMLLMLYFFYPYLIYVIIFLFAMAATASLFACAELLVLWSLPTRWTAPAFTCFTPRCGQMAYYQTVLLAAAVGVSVTWFVVRRHPYAWILQDLLGVCFSLNMLRTIRLPSYKICVVLLSALFFYDIFFVFITPWITGNKTSVMENVATGGSEGKSRCGSPPEVIPMVMRIPHWIFKSRTPTGADSPNPLVVCRPDADSLLGFGDILVPGLLMSYCHAFDLIFAVKWRLYYVTTCVGYGLGLIATYAGLYLMEGMAQPALLYLVPFTLTPPLVIALYRQEFAQFWSGPELSRSSPSAAANGSPKAKRDSESGATAATGAAIEDNNLLIGSADAGAHNPTH